MKCRTCRVACRPDTDVQRGGDRKWSVSVCLTISAAVYVVYGHAVAISGDARPSRDVPGQYDTVAYIACVVKW